MRSKRSPGLVPQNISLRNTPVFFKVATVCGLIVWSILLLRAQSAPSDQGTADQSRGIHVVEPAAGTTASAWRVHKDYALLFATDTYDSWPALSNPIPDAQGIADELHTNYGFDTRIVENPTRDQIVGTLRDFSKKPFGPADQLFIFFAGHGLYDEVFKQGFIVAKDSRMDDTNHLTYESYEDLRQIINAIPAKHILLVLDACFSGTFDRRIGESATRGTESYSSFSFEELFDNKASLATRKYLTSGGKDYVPDGLPGHHSPFASQLLNVLRTYGGKQGYITFAGLLSGVEDIKPQPFWGQWGDDEPGSEFLFAAKPVGPSSSALLSAAQPTTGISERGSYRADLVSSAPKRPSIAVLGFENISKKPDAAWLSNAISEELRTDLAAGEKLRSVTSESVARLKSDLGLGDASGYAPDTLARIFKILGSDYVVTGSYLPLVPNREYKIRVELRLQDARSGDMLVEAAESGSAAEFPDLIARLGGRLRDKLGIASPSPTQASSARASSPSNPDVVRAYTDGLAKLRAYKLLDARDLLERAVASDPKFALAHEALAETWSELGYDQNGLEEARLAVNLSAGLSYENRLAIEGRYRQMSSEWDRAIEIYHSLWTVFPDETEYGLELAAVQTAAGRGKDALGTIATLRSAEAAASSNDPRIDYQEALAAGSLADVTQEQAAAARAANAGFSKGERLLASEAFWRDCDALFALGNTAAAESACERANAIASSGAGLKFQARSLTVLANIREKQGKASEAMELREEALRLARQTGSRKDIIGSLMNLAISLDMQGQSTDARAHYQEAIGIAREIDDKQQLGDLDYNLAANYYTQGDYRSAKPLYEQSLQIAKETGNQSGEASALESLGIVYFDLGQLDQSRKNTEDALVIARNAKLQGIDALSLSQLGDIQLTQADFSAARGSYDAALKLFTERGDQSGIASTRVCLANLTLEQGKAAEAETLSRQAVEEFQNEKLVDNEADARNTLARALIAQNKLPEAQEQLDAAQANGVQDQQVKFSVRITAARLKARTGNAANAAQDLGALLSETRELSLVGTELEIRLAEAEVQIASSKRSTESAVVALTADAKKQGYFLLAQKAAALSNR